MNIKERLLRPAYMTAYDIINDNTCSPSQAAGAIRRRYHRQHGGDAAEVVAGLGLIAADKRYIATARRRARIILEILIVG